jgi:hypothetical protein
MAARGGEGPKSGKSRRSKRLAVAVANTAQYFWICFLDLCQIKKKTNKQGGCGPYVRRILEML